MLVGPARYRGGMGLGADSRAAEMPFFCWHLALRGLAACEPRRYFLSQGFRVVAVEANRRAIQARHAQSTVLQRQDMSVSYEKVAMTIDWVKQLPQNLAAFTHRYASRLSRLRPLVLEGQLVFLHAVRSSEDPASSAYALQLGVFTVAACGCPSSRVVMGRAWEKHLHSGVRLGAIPQRS